jgi:hypothetical protein
MSWKHYHYRLGSLDMADYWHITGILIRGVVLLGVLWKPNYPADDVCWPNAGGEIGIVLFNHIWGWWNDPGF